MSTNWEQVNQGLTNTRRKQPLSKRVWNQIKTRTPINNTAQEHDFLVQLAIEINYSRSARRLLECLEQVSAYKSELELRFPDWSLSHEPTLPCNSLFLDPFPEQALE